MSQGFFVRKLAYIFIKPPKFYTSIALNCMLNNPKIDCRHNNMSIIEHIDLLF